MQKQKQVQFKRKECQTLSCFCQKLEGFLELLCSKKIKVISTSDIHKKRKKQSKALKDSTTTLQTVGLLIDTLFRSNFHDTYLFC